MEPTKTFLSWSSNPSHKGWLSFAAREGAERHQASLAEEHRAGITTGDAAPGTSMINGKFHRPDTPRPMLVAFGPDARLSYHGEIENQRADALRQLGEYRASDSAEPTA